MPVTEEIYEEFHARGVGSTLFFLTELGYGGLGDLPSIVSEYDAATEGHRHDFRQQKGFLDSLRSGLVKAREMTRRGATALVLESLPRNLKNLLFRNELWTTDCKGLLVGALHYAKPHPVIFRDLPHGALGREYAHLLPDENLKEHNFPPGSEVLAGSFSCDCAGFVFQASLASIPEGKGRYIFSQFKLADMLGKDPAADRLFCNLVHEAAKQLEAS